MFAWLPAQHLQRLPAGGLGAVQPAQWFTSGCSEARARWLTDGSIETDAGVQELVLPKDVHQWTGLIKSAAAKAGAPAQLVAGIMATESGGQPQAKSYCCYGLMGFLPATASWVAGRTVTPQELLSDTTLNVELGAKLVRTLLDKYGNNPIKVALAYNAGSVKCGAPKACPDAPNQWNAITDCAQGKAVDYPARMFGYSNAWHKLHGKMKIDLNLDLKFGPSFYLELALKTAAVVGIGYVAYKGVSGGKLLRNPELWQRPVLSLDPPPKSRKLYWQGYRRGYADAVNGQAWTEEEQAKNPRQYVVGYWMGFRQEWGEP